ncbi:hypothetical protein DYB35_008910 [Aphanomyces astaci]|uniref:Uncharacterized protein n=1 Tax=Aphanomyces astaci TaxID=112090 RepID=A0A3R7BAG1_APHAT|nr:hypothetical protein DYB35_008910 [Aphanomyces astaci]
MAGIHAGLYEELRKLERIHLKKQVVTVWYVKNQIQLLEQRTAQLDPTPTEAEDAAAFFLQYASSHSLRRQFVMQTLIHATRFDTQTILKEMDRRDMTDRAGKCLPFIHVPNM